MKEKIRAIEETHKIIHNLETLLLTDGYYKKQLANLVGTTADKIEAFMSTPMEANPHEDWCHEVNWLYELHHKQGYQEYCSDDFYD